MTQIQADALIAYIEALEERTNHQSVMAALKEAGYTEKEIDEACRALGSIAHRDFSIL